MCVLTQYNPKKITQRVTIHACVNENYIVLALDYSEPTIFFKLGLVYPFSTNAKIKKL